MIQPHSALPFRVACCLLSVCCLISTLPAAEPVPDKVVVLTFDDSVRSHFTVARPLLKKYRFGATFFITEGFDFKTDKDNYMTWEQILRQTADSNRRPRRSRCRVFSLAGWRPLSRSTSA